MKNVVLLVLLCASAGFLCSPQPARAAGPPWKFSASDGNHSVTFGFLAQPQFESLEYPAAAGENLNNVFLRRLRLIAGGKLTSKLSYFLESDSPNLGKKGFDGKRSPDIFLQDAYVNYAFRPQFQLDGGMLIIPVSHNSAQSAASLLAIDYSPYSFLASEPTHSKNGRDYGVQARGYIKNHFEYRAGVYRGNTDNDSAFPYRYMLRFVYYPFQPETGLFYTGTNFGQKKIVGIGATIDRQAGYSANSLDLFVDLPIRKGDAITVQADFIRYDGGTTFPALLPQNTWLLESSYYLKRIRLGPFLQWASRDLANPGLANDQRLQGGIAFWPLKHRVNVKAGLAHLYKAGSQTRTQFVLQGQFFYF